MARESRVSSGAGMSGFRREAEEAGKASGKAAQGMMQLGYAVDDLQYGFGAIVNNIQPVVSSFTTAGLAGAIGIASVAAYQLYSNWDVLTNALGLGKVRSEAEEMEQLADATARTALETANLNRYKKEQSDIQALMSARPKEETERGSAIGQAITDADPKEVGDKLVLAMRAAGQGVKLTPEEVAEKFGPGKITEKDAIRINAAGGAFAGNNPMADLGQDAERLAIRQRKIDSEVSKQDHDRAEKLMVKAKTDPLALKELVGYVDKSPQLFPEGFKDKLLKASDSVEEKKREEAEKKKEKEEKEKEAEEKKQEREQEKADREEEKSRKKKLELAKMFDPGLDQAADDIVLRKKVSAKPGDPMSKVGVDTVNELVPRLEKLGMTKEGARQAAEDQFEISNKRVGPEALKRFVDDDQKWQKDRRKEKHEEADKLIPALDKKTDAEVMRGRLDGLPADQVGKALREALERAGMGKEDAKLAAEDQVKESTARVNEKIEGHELTKKEGEHKESKSEIYSASSLTEKIQSSISDAASEPKKQTSLMEQMVQELAAIKQSQETGILRLRVD